MDEPTIIFRDLPDGLLGFTDGTSTIWIDKHLSQVDRRVVIEHELVHYVRGHRGHCLAVHEHGIDRIVASGLIHLDELGDAAAWSPHPWVIAEELDVHPDTVADRLHALTAGERTALALRLADAHWAT